MPRKNEVRRWPLMCFRMSKSKRLFRIKGVWIIVRSSLFSVEGRVLQSVPRVSLNTIKHVLTLVRTVHIKNTKNVSITAPVDTIDMNHIVLKRVLSTISSINQIIYVSTSARVLNIINRKMYSVWIPVQKKRLKLIRHAYLIVPKVDHFYTRCHVLQHVLFRPSILNRKKNQTLLSLIPVSKNAKKIHIVNQQHVRWCLLFMESFVPGALSRRVSRFRSCESTFTCNTCKWTQFDHFCKFNEAD